MKTIFMFPGQGAQHVGMGKALADGDPAVASLFQQANQIVGYDLASLCFDGPEDKLNTTAVSQPAIFVTTAACLQALSAGNIAPDLKDVSPDAFAGLSLGEYSALYAAGAMSFVDALKLVQLRGESMQAAAELRQGAMVSILGLDEPAVEKLCQAALDGLGSEDDGLPPVLAGVNFNCPGQIVISGTIKACLRAEQLAPDHGAGRAIALKVAGGFHTSLMDPAAEKLRQALDQCQFRPLAHPVVANISAQRYDGPAGIPDTLMKQLVSPIRWQQSIEFLLEQGAQTFVEIGPGRVLTGLVKKIARDRKQKVNIVTVNGTD